MRIGGSLEVDGGSLISHGTMHVYNDVTCTGGTLVLMEPTIFSMTGSDVREVSFDATKLYLPIVPSPGGGYPEKANELIRLSCGDRLAGSADLYVYLLAPIGRRMLSFWDTNVGTNYINANAALSDAEMRLANEGAWEQGYYFKRVEDDTKTQAATNRYDMWQIAKSRYAIRAT